MLRIFHVEADIEKGEHTMTEDLIKQIKKIKQALVNVDMSGDDWEEREEILDKLEDVTTYLKDAMGKGIEF